MLFSIERQQERREANMCVRKRALRFEKELDRRLHLQRSVKQRNRSTIFFLPLSTVVNTHHVLTSRGSKLALLCCNSLALCVPTTTQSRQNRFFTHSLSFVLLPVSLSVIRFLVLSGYVLSYRRQTYDGRTIRSGILSES